MEQHGADGHTHSTAELPPEVEQRHTDAAIFPWQGILHHHREGGQHQTQTDTGKPEGQSDPSIKVDLPERHRREAKAHRDKALVVTGTAYQLAADKGAGGDADHEDHHAHPALAGAQPLLPLHL